MTGPATDIVVMESIDKSFPGVHALKSVSFTLARGEIHALVGENGAGKSTLIRVLTGVERPDGGTITLDGAEVTIRSPLHAQSLGISTVYQEVNLCPNLTVAENLLIGRQPMKLGHVDWKSMNRQAREILQGLDIEIDVTRPLGSYSIAIQQMAAIARALVIASAKVLVLDEPTSSLTAHETEQLFRVMRKLKGEGIAIVFITHFLDQVYEVSDRVTILRNGAFVGVYQTAALPRLTLITLMLGRSLTELDDINRHRIESSQHIETEPLLEAVGVGLVGSIAPFDLVLHAGEVVGLAGLLGSGRTEVARLIGGVDRVDSGQLKVNGEVLKLRTPRQAIKNQIAYSSENRRAEGIVDELSVRDNIILALQADRGWFKPIPRKRQDELAASYIEALNIKTPSADTPVRNLSGGNQQKVLLARWLAIAPRLLILDEPTRGIDVGAKAEIQKLVYSLAENGMSVLFISAELEEVLRLSNRIVVLRDRQKVADLLNDGLDVDDLLALIAEGATEPEPVTGAAS